MISFFMGADEQSEKGLVYFLATLFLTFPTFGVARAPEILPDGVHPIPLEFCLQECPGILPKQIIIEDGRVYETGDGSGDLPGMDTSTGEDYGPKHDYKRLLG